MCVPFFFSFAIRFISCTQFVLEYGVVWRFESNQCVLVDGYKEKLLPLTKCMSKNESISSVSNGIAKVTQMPTKMLGFQVAFSTLNTE